MKGMIAIAKKDFKSIVLSPIFFIVGGLVTMILSFNFAQRLFEFDQRSKMISQFGNQARVGLDIHLQVFVPHISILNFVLMMAVPALTMRLLAEEKRTRTYDLLLTSPVTATDIIVGKLLAVIGASGILVALSFAYPVSTSFFTTFDWGSLVASYIGLMLLVACYCAIGLFCSSITDSSVLAIISGVILNVGLWLLGTGGDLADSDLTRKIFEHLSIGSHLISFVKGSIRISALVFFLSVIGLYSFLTQRVVESSRWR